MRHLLIVALLALPVFAAAADPFEIKDGERIAYVGNTFVERDQTYGYFETLLTSRHAGKKIILRNLGWSGDTVWGIARAGFGRPEDGYNSLIQHVNELKPTLILLSCGMNESFDGEAKLGDFVKQFDKLLTDLAATTARIIVISPLPHEKMPSPLPDPNEHNRNLRIYIDAMRKAAEAKGHGFVDLFALVDDAQNLLGERRRTLTDNGIHLTPYGHWHTALLLEQGFKLPPRAWEVNIDVKRNLSRTTDVTLSDLRADKESVAFKVTSRVLPPPPAPEIGYNLRHFPCVLRVAGLSSGRYVLKIDGVETIIAKNSDWQSGVALSSGGDWDQAEKLRQTINKKNELYFHRWRPQNHTYIFGFRKSEQGRNAVEIPQFDPLIEAEEKIIATLAVPRQRTFELVKTDKDEKKDKKKEKDK